MNRAQKQGHKLCCPAWWTETRKGLLVLYEDLRERPRETKQDLGP